MAIVAAVTNSYKQDVLNGVHQPGDAYKIALYVAAAALSKSTTAYSAANEASGQGYTAGGQALVGFTVGIDVDTAYLDWTTDPVWNAATLTARGALIYNSTRSNKAVAVLDFGADITSTAAPFTITLPAPTAAAAVVRLA